MEILFIIIFVLIVLAIIVGNVNNNEATSSLIKEESILPLSERNIFHLNDIIFNDSPESSALFYKFKKYCTSAEFIDSDSKDEYKNKIDSLNINSFSKNILYALYDALCERLPNIIENTGLSLKEGEEVLFYANDAYIQRGDELNFDGNDKVYVTNKRFIFILGNRPTTSISIDRLLDYKFTKDGVLLTISNRKPINISFRYDMKFYRTIGNSLKFCDDRIKLYIVIHLLKTNKIQVVKKE